MERIGVIQKEAFGAGTARQTPWIGVIVFFSGKYTLSPKRHFTAF
jgi:hypothetical protein